MPFAQKERVLKLMILIYAVFGASIIYFLFFNTGLEIIPDLQSRNSVVNVANNSVHAIREVHVSFVKNDAVTEVQVIPILNPKESVELSLSPEWASNGSITLVVSAPFHLARQSIITNLGGNSANANITFQLSYSDTGFVNSLVEIEIIAVNNESTLIPVKAELTFLNASVFENPPVKEWELQPGFNTTSFVFTPGSAMETLSIKIRVFSEWDTFLEREISMGIIEIPENE